ncbi:MAG: hypothetical protein AB1714_04300 [Acidobacteriota bacterium]
MDVRLEPRRRDVARYALSGLAMCLCMAVLSQPIHAQTLVARARVSDPKGINIAPHLVPLQSGNFAAVWGYASSSNYQSLIPYGRVMKPDGKPATPVRKNLITAKLYPYLRFVAGQTAGGRVLVVGTRESDSLLVVRALDSNLRVIGGLAVARYSGYGPALVAGDATGAVLAYYSADTSDIAQLDESGRFATEPVPLTQSPVNFVVDSVTAAPGGYLALGRDLKSEQSRAVGVPVPSDLGTPGAGIAYEKKYSPFDNSMRTYGGFLGESGLAVYGHWVNQNKSVGFTQALLSTGKPKGAPRKYPSSAQTPGFLNIIPLGGSEKFAACYLNGYVNCYIQLLDERGVPAGDPVPAAADDYSVNLEQPGVAWNPASSTLAVAYAIYSSTPTPHYELWIALYKLTVE